jgi:hypothetical protein
MRYMGNNRISVNNHTISYNDEGPDEAPVIRLIRMPSPCLPSWNLTR